MSVPTESNRSILRPAALLVAIDVRGDDESTQASGHETAVGRIGTPIVGTALVAKEPGLRE